MKAAFSMKICLFVGLFYMVQAQDFEIDRKDPRCTIHGERCFFPFNFREKDYDACTSDAVSSNRTWCVTKVYKNGSADINWCQACWGRQRCYLTAALFPNDDAWSMTCPPGCLYVQSKMYGTDNEFSADSYICASAIHEGIISNDTGGEVAFYKAPWKKYFPRETKNGINSKLAVKKNFPMIKFKKDQKDFPKVDMIFTNKKTDISALTGDSTIYTNLVKNQKYALGLASDFKNKKIYWTDIQGRSIWSATWNGRAISNKRQLIRGAKTLKPENVAIDWIHRNLFWTDSGFHSVGMLDSNGLNIVTLVKGNKYYEPRGLAVDPKNGYVYVTDFGRNAKIQKCSMGKRDDCETLIDKDIEWPSGIAVDIDSGIMCWTDRKQPQISCSNVNGLQRRNMDEYEGRLRDPYAIAIHGKRIYWTDWLHTGILSANYKTWKELHFHVGELKQSGGLSIFEAQKMYSNQCIDSSPCQHLCVPSTGGRKCLCADGYFAQNADASVCGLEKPTSPPPASRLDIYVADFTAIKKLSVKLDTRETKSSMLIKSSSRVTATAIDTQKNIIYWSTTSSGKIEMAPLSSSLKKKTFLDSTSGYLEKVEGLAIDPVTQLLYWTDVALHSVFAANLDPIKGEHHVTVVIKGSDRYQPKGIALDPERGYMYIVDSYPPTYIQKCEMIGDPTCQIILQGFVLGLQHIAIDFESDRLYFTDSKSFKIESCDLNGRNRKVILKDKKNLPNPYGIGVFHDRVYYNDWTDRSLKSAEKDTGKNIQIITRNLLRPMGMSFINPLKPKSAVYANVCAGNKCTANTICFPTPIQKDGKHYACLCPEKLKGVSKARECKKEIIEEEPLPPCGPGLHRLCPKCECTDINECEKDNGGCEGKCQNGIGSYRCLCSPGSKLAPDKKKCIPSDPCVPNPCKNEGKCNERDSSFECECEIGFNGSTCTNVNVQLLLPGGDLTTTIRLECIAPAKLKHSIIWRHNRVHIDVSSKWAKIEREGRVLVIYRPHYSYSGEYTCQVNYGGNEYPGKATLKIPVKPSVVCGKAPGMEFEERTIKPKVLGGKMVAPAMAPFVAMIYKKTVRVDPNPVNQGVFCGGSIVDTKHILTAAHCFRHVEDKEIRVYVGKRDTQIKVIEPHQQWSDAEKIITHPEYDPHTLNIDIAIIVLKDEIYFSEAVKPICIPGNNNKDDDVKPRPYKDKKKTKHGLVFGWGITERKEKARHLLELKLPIVDQKTCKNAYDTGEITEYMFCAGGEKHKDACEGDSGGPFVLWSTEKRTWHQAGIVSWGSPCKEDKSKPGVYTRLEKNLRRWIRKNTDI